MKKITFFMNITPHYNSNKTVRGKVQATATIISADLIRSFCKCSVLSYIVFGIPNVFFINSQEFHKRKSREIFRTLDLSQMSCISIEVSFYFCHHFYSNRPYTDYHLFETKYACKNWNILGVFYNIQIDTDLTSQTTK